MVKIIANFLMIFKVPPHSYHKAHSTLKDHQKLCKKKLAAENEEKLKLLPKIIHPLAFFVHWALDRKCFFAFDGLGK